MKLMLSHVVGSLAQSTQSKASLSIEERERTHHKVLKIARIWGIVSSFVAILTIGSIILVFGAVLVIAFLGKDISILKDVVFPVIIPSILTFFVVCLPLIIFIFKKQKEKAQLSQKVAKAEYGMIRGFYDRSPITKPDKKLIANFIETEVFVGKHNKFYFLETLEYIKKEFPAKKQRNQDDNNLLEGIARASENLKLSKVGRDKRDQRELKEEKKPTTTNNRPKKTN